jgi:simple sugar transport system ATP-binding protein
VVPEDRSTEGLIPAMSLTENVVLGLDRDPRWSARGWLDWKAARAHTARLLASYDVRAPSPEVRAGTLSGGNQQKLILARAFDGSPRILVAENPTRGLDIKASAEVHARLRTAAAAGMLVLVYSSDLDEVLELAGRVLVMHAGRIREAPAGASRQLVGSLMLGLDGER